MQVNATLIAAQQAAREAQARFQAQHVVSKPTAAAPLEAKSANFAATLEKDLFAPLPLKQTAAPQAAPRAQATANPSPNARPGSLLDIRI
jgi:hypothetical protein